MRPKVKGGVWEWRYLITVDREIFMLKIILAKNFRVGKFSRFNPQNFLMVGGYIMDERLEHPKGGSRG